MSEHIDSLVPDKVPGGEPPKAKEKIEQLFENFEMMHLQSAGVNVNSISGFLKNLNDEQRSELIELLKKREDAALHFHTKKLDNKKEIKLAQINASTVHIRANTKNLTIVAGALFAVTMTILLVKPDLFQIWLAFVTGVVGGALGGYGVGKIQNISKPKEGDS